ncbi:PR domain zinc finger protein 10 isoform X4 [Cryptotermes secundus]|uniref:PR domain zinc finger protein 10 isoform X4 n=1 Tax=Cryptotermes secundus TaxID=105785 RepID=UPI000CD7C339|nr:PR domain zinc finger protein 10 isoform X4 [Cryptotermes secundus]
MESTDPQVAPGDVEDDDGITGSTMPTNQAEAELDDWSPVTSSQLESSVQKVAASSSRLLFLAVEYVEEPPNEYGRSAFSSFEPGAPFSPQASSSLSEFEHRVSPLDPNLSSAARYSPVYAITGTSTGALAVITGEASSAGGTSTSSNPSSPFPTSQVVSPIINSSPANALPSSPSSGNPYIDTTQGHATTVAHSYVNPSSPLQILSDNPTSTEEGLLRQVVTGSTYFRTTAASSTSGSILGPTPPHSPLQAPLTPTESYVVSSSTGPLADTVPATSSDYHGNGEVTVAVAVTTSPGRVDSSSELMIQQEAVQLVGGAADGGEQYHRMSGRLKTEGGSVQLLISSSDGSSITYSLDPGQTGYVEQLDTVLDTFKSQGLVIEEGEEGDLRVSQHSVTQDVTALPLDVSLNVTTEQQQNLIETELLDSQVNGGIGTQVRELEHPLLGEDVDMNLGVSASGLKTAGPENYANILLNGHDETIAKNSSNTLPRRSKRHQIQVHNSQQQTNADCKDDTKSFWCEECCSSYEHGCPQHRVQSICDKPVPSRAWATLPASYLAINRVGTSSDGSPVHGVFARKTIPKRTQFGPIEGVLVKADDPHMIVAEGEEPQLELLVESETGAMLKLDTGCENSSNWMRFVRAAENFKDQNLILSQQGHCLYFTSTRVIHPRQELQVWYSFPYANKRGLPLLQPDVEKRAVEEVEHMWPCFECNGKFASSEELQKHLNIHDNERDEDGDSLKSKSKKSGRTSRRKGLSHFASKKFKSDSDNHNELYPYQCHICHRAFPRNYSLKRHQLLHAGDKKYVCEICGYEFSHVHNRDRHVRKHHKNQEGESNGVHASNACMKKKPPGPSKEWLCSHCSLTFTSASVLNLHTLAHAADNLEEAETITGLPSDFHSVYHAGEFLVQNGDVQCPQCTQEFPSKKELIEHVTAHGKLTHPQPRPRMRSVNPAKPWKCELCYKSFATDDRLQRHMLVHGAEESKPLQCDICYKRFLNNSAVACHVKIHSEKKSFECCICKTVFDQYLALKEHIPIHAVNGRFTCRQCTKVFDEYSLLRKHNRAFHSDRKHICLHCSNLFPTLDKLRMHMLRHSDHREFLCANCGKQFKRKDKLKEHTNRMHSAERELRLAMKLHRAPTAKKFMPKVQVSPTDYHRFIYKCHTCLLGFKRRGMLVNHLAKRHPDISPDSVPELNLPILKTTRDYYCQYCEKIYKSSSKRKAHILKNHPGAELPMSNRRKGGVPEIPGVPNPTFSQTVGSVTTHPHGCLWCHKQYASKAKLLQHQRKKHVDLLPQNQQSPRAMKNPNSPGGPEGGKFLPVSVAPASPTCEAQQVVQLQSTADSVVTPQTISIIPAEYQITGSEGALREYQHSGIIIDTSTLKRPLKSLADGVSAELLTQAMTELSQISEFRVSVSGSTTSGHDHYFKIVQTSSDPVTVTQSGQSETQPDSSSTADTPGQDHPDPLSPASAPAPTSTSHLQHLLTSDQSYSLPSSPATALSSSSPGPRAWTQANAIYTPYTAR